MRKDFERITFLCHLECCKDMKNFNSMFAIISGLDHKTVQRLQATWERVPDKYKKIFEVKYYPRPKFKKRSVTVFRRIGKKNGRFKE